MKNCCANQRCMYGSGTGPLQHQNRPGRDSVCQGKGKFGKLGGEKSCIVVYGSARSGPWPKRYGYHLRIIMILYS